MVDELRTALMRKLWTPPTLPTASKPPETETPEATERGTPNASIIDVVQSIPAQES